MTKKKRFITNSIIFTISNFSSKILIFFLLPVYTRYLTPSELGEGDILILVLGLISPILTLAVTEGVLRFSMSKNNNTNAVFTYGILVIFAGFFLLIILSPIFFLFEMFSKYIWLLILIFLFTSLNMYMNQFLRGVNKIKLIGVVGIISTLVFISSTLIFIVILNYGVFGYLLAFISMNFVSFLILAIFGKVHRYFSIKSLTKSEVHDVNKFNLPLIPSKISFNLINSSGRYVTIIILGASFTGILSAAFRIPAVLTAIYAIINQAMLLSTIDEFETEGKFGFFEKLYVHLDEILFLSAIFIGSTIKIYGSFFFYGEYFEAYKIVPFLLAATYFGSLHGSLTSFYTALKNTKYLAYTAVAGMIIAIILNILFIYMFGIVGIGLANVLVYFLMWLLLYTKADLKLKSVKNTEKMIFKCIILVLSILLVNVLDGLMYYVSCFLIIVITVVFVKNEIAFLFKSIISVIKDKIIKT